MRLLTAAALAALLASCASAPSAPPGAVAAVGTPADQKAFSGLWRGTIEHAGQAAAPIEFRLEPGEMLFQTPARTPRKIKWVRFSDGKMTGATDTWYDPVRKADVYSTFEATLAGGVMHGIVRDKVGTEWTEVARFTATRAGD